MYILSYVSVSPTLSARQKLIRKLAYAAVGHVGDGALELGGGIHHHFDIGLGVPELGSFVFPVVAW